MTVLIVGGPGKIECFRRNGPGGKKTLTARKFFFRKHQGRAGLFQLLLERFNFGGPFAFFRILQVCPGL